MIDTFRSTSTSLESVKFQSGHWQESKVLAHIRFNERTDADGDRVLFVEEIQSDWGKAGKRQGFGQQQRYSNRDQDGNVRGDFDSEVAAQAYLDYAPVFGDASVSTIIRSANLGFPTAPFVGKTEAWANLAVKSLIRYAAQNGVDNVAFVNGQQSAERYSLEKQVSEIRVPRRDDGHYSVFATRLQDDEGGESRLADRAGIDAQVLSDFIGKDLADKAIAALDAKSKAQQQSIQLYRVESADGQQLDGHNYQLAKAQSLARSYGLIRSSRCFPAST